MHRAYLIMLALAGCAVSPALGPEGLPVYRAQTISDSAPPAQGEAEIVVRAVDADGDVRPGATCTAESIYAKAEFPAPARFLLPHQGPASRAVTITCRDSAGGGTVQVLPRIAGTQGIGGWPALGVSVNSGGGFGIGIGWQGGSVATGAPLVLYPEARVILD